MHSRHHPMRPSRGFTLVELIVAIAVVAIVAAIAIPSFREISLRMATTTNTNDLVGALNIARAEAVKRGRAVGVVANGGNWNDGWQIVVSKTVSGVLEPVPTSPGATEAACAGSFDDGMPMCTQHRGPLENGFTLLAKATGSAGSDGIVIFSPVGALRDATAFDFSLCLPADRKDPLKSRRIRVAPSGVIDSIRNTTGAPAGSCN